MPPLRSLDVSRTAIGCGLLTSLPSLSARRVSACRGPLDDSPQEPRCGLTGVWSCQSATRQVASGEHHEPRFAAQTQDVRQRLIADWTAFGCAAPTFSSLRTSLTGASAPPCCHRGSTMVSSRARTILSWVARLAAAAILATAGVAKVSAAPEPMVLFTILGAEPWGRLLVGALELLTTILLLWSRTTTVGAALGVVLMLGALGTHILKIGINYGGNPSLFIMACVVLAACVTTLALRKPI